MTPSDNTDPKLEEEIEGILADHMVPIGNRIKLPLGGELPNNWDSCKAAILKAIQADRESVSMVNHTSPYEPITVVDQFGNKYVCLNYYEAMQLERMLISMQGRGIADYDTGDWWRDLPVKLTKWLAQLTKGSDE